MSEALAGEAAAAAVAFSSDGNTTGNESNTERAAGESNKMKERLERIRKKRAEGGSTEGSSAKGGIGTDGSKTPRQSAEASNDRRKMLQRLRQKARGGEGETDDPGSAPATRRSKLGSRTPRSGKFRRSGTRTPRGRGFSEDEDEEVFSDQGDDTATEKAHGEEEGDEIELPPLLQIEEPQIAYPMSLWPRDRQLENKLQHVLIIPAPSRSAASASNLSQRCVRITCSTCDCCECCPTLYKEKSLDDDVESQVRRKRSDGHDIWNERQFLQMKDNSEMSRWVRQQTMETPEMQRLHQLLEEKERSLETLSITIGRNTGRFVSSSGYSHESTQSSSVVAVASASANIMDSRINRSDGMYNGNPPVLMPMLLDGEHVLAAIAQFTAPHVLLSRITQRIMRDLIGDLEVMRFRKKWRQMSEMVMGVTQVSDVASAFASRLADSGALRSGFKRPPLAGSRNSALNVSFTLPSDRQRQENISNLEMLQSSGENDAGDSSNANNAVKHSNSNDDNDATEEDNLMDISRETSDQTQTKKQLKERTDFDSLPAQVMFLKQLDTAPMLQVIENPVIKGVSQPMIPVVQLSYGGQLGQWSIDSNPEDRLGILPPGWSGRKGGQRAVFRLHLHQVAITDHQLMSAEERCLIDLKEHFAKYRTLFEQRTLEYYSSKLLALTEQLISLVEIPQQQYEEDDLISLRAVYRDLIDTLPVLNDVNHAVNILTDNVYSGWRELNEIRRRQGIVNTPVELTVRQVRVVDSTSVPVAGDSEENIPVAADEGNKDLEQAAKVWTTLRSNLTKVPALIAKAQSILFPLNAQETGDSSSEVGSQMTPQGSDPSGQNQAWRVHEDNLAKEEAMQKVVSGVKNAVDELIEADGLIPKYILRLTDEGQVTSETLLPPHESRRRAQLSNLKMKATLKIDGYSVTSSDWCPLDVSTMTVDFNQYFEFRVLHQPSDVALILSMTKHNGWDTSDTHLATINVPVSGGLGGGGGSTNTTSLGGLAARGGNSNSSSTQGRHQHVAHAYAPTVGWYSFTSALPRKSSLSDSFRALSGVSRDKEQLILRRTEGAVLCTTEYDTTFVEGNGESHVDGIRGEELALVPKLRSQSTSTSAYRSSKEKLRKKSKRGGGVGGRVNDFTLENDFQALLPDLEDIDLNDPRNDHLLYLKSKKVHTDNKVFFRTVGYDYAAVFHGHEGNSIANYAKYKEPSRFKLLRLRVLKPYLFNEPIPIREGEIRSSEVFKSILVKELGEEIRRYDGKALIEEDDDPAETIEGLAGNQSVNVAKVTNFLQRIRNSQTARTRKRKKKNFLTPSVVIEQNYLTALQPKELPALFDRKRSLHPKPKTRIPVAVQLDKCDLLVQVVAAKNIPLRTELEALKAGLSTRVSRRGSVKQPLDEEAGHATGGAGATIGAIGDDEPIVSEHVLDERKLKESKRARTFIEVKFQEHAVATGSYDGTTPLWQQSFQLPFRPPQDDFSPANLEQLREVVYFTLFDEVVEDDSGRGGLLEGEPTIRVEKRYLGSMAVPFDTIYREGRIEGVFRIDTPVMNFGYDHSATRTDRRVVGEDSMFLGGNAPDTGDSADGAPLPPPSLFWDTVDYIGSMFSSVSNTGLEMILPKPKPKDNFHDDIANLNEGTHSEFSYFATDDQATYLKIMLTLDPLLIAAPDVVEELAVGNTIRDDRKIAAYAVGWMEAIKSIGEHTRRRNYKLFGTNSDGQNVLICRFLTPLKPPKGFNTRRSCLHLVSNIPFMKDAQSFLGEMDLWCTCQQFWDIGAGDEEEHAMTLANYLYYLEAEMNDTRGQVGYPSDEAIAKESVFLVMGRAIPEGETVYVMLRDHRRKNPQSGGPENFLIINPWTGYLYSALDPNCPLKDISILATPYNLWANLQEARSPSELMYDLFNPDLWRPFFGARMPPPKGGLSCVQAPIAYNECNPGYAVQVEKTLFQSIRNNIRKWRSKRHRSTTTFHPDACAAMHDLLPKLENWKRCGNPDLFLGGVSESQKQMDQNAVLQQLQEGIRDRMKSLLRTRTLKGFPVNMPFTDVEEVLTKVRTWCIHEAKHPEVQFVMAVRAFPLYNNILSLWIFLGTLETTAL